MERTRCASAANSRSRWRYRETAASMRPPSFFVSNSDSGASSIASMTHPCRSSLEAGVHDEGDPTGLAAPRRVAVLLVVDASAEGGTTVSQMSFRVPCFAGGSERRNRSVSCRLSAIDKSPNSGFRHTRDIQSCPARAHLRANGRECLHLFYCRNRCGRRTSRVSAVLKHLQQFASLNTATKSALFGPGHSG